jgi:hypothetical protein
MKAIFAMIEKYLLLVIAGVHAANTVQDAANADKKQVVFDTVTKVADAVSAASGNPTVAAVGAMIDVAATVINVLTTKTATPKA